MSEQEVPRKIKIACPKCLQKIDVTELPSFSRINCPVCNQPLIVPKWFHSYLLEEIEGRGGMATVYRALDVALDREVAIKIMDAKPGVSSDRFLQEARMAATINHNAVVPIYSCGENDGSAFVVMQFMGGGTLEQRLNRANGRLPIAETARWIRDICEGLDNARAHNIVHHDIKPANILLDLESNAKIGDFGLAQVLMREPGMRMGGDTTRMWVSPHYVSPEKVRTGEEGPDGDIYSLGATFYQLLTGTTPFRNNDTEELLRMRLEQDPVPPVMIRPEIGQTLSQLIMSMMNRNPVERPAYKQIIQQIQQGLEELSRGGAVRKESNEVKKKVFRVNEEYLKGKNVRRISHVGSLTFLLIVVCLASVALLIPKYADKRELYTIAPFLKSIYGEVPPEKPSFMPTDIETTFPDFEECADNAESVFFDETQSLRDRAQAAWLIGVRQILNRDPDAIALLRDLSEQLVSASNLRNENIADELFCISVIANKNYTLPKYYLSDEQIARYSLGKMLRALYDMDTGAMSESKLNNEIARKLENFRKNLEVLPVESWVYSVFAPCLTRWIGKAIENKTVPNLEPLFMREQGETSGSQSSSSRPRTQNLSRPARQPATTGDNGDVSEGIDF